MKAKAYRLYYLLDRLIKQEHAKAKTLADLQALDEYRILKSEVKSRFRLKVK